MDPETATAGRARYYRACVIGGLVAALAFTWMLAVGRLDLLQQGPVGNLYDAQARSLFDLRWDMPRDELGIEAWIVDGKAYTYFGPVPSLLRMPIAALTDRFDGRLTQLSMLAAFVVLLVFTTRLGWRIRGLVRGDAPVSIVEAWAAGAFTFVLGAGSVVLFLASRAFIYHEAELWGAALAIASFDFLLAFIVAPERRSLVWAAVFGGLAFLTRGSVGVGPLVAIALLLLARVLVLAQHRIGRDRLRDRLVAPLRWLGVGSVAANRTYLVPLALAGAVPAALYTYVNYARFGHPWTLPIRQHITVLEAQNAMRIEALEANGNSQFGFKFIPTNVLAMLRPDALRLDGLFPFLDFPPPADVIGNVRFDTIDVAGSIPATMPLLFVLACIGTIGVVRRQAAGSFPSLAALRVPVIGAFAGGFVTLTIYFIAHRYISDLLPLVVLLALAGLHLLVRAYETHRRRRGVGRAVAVGLVGLGVFSLWANFGLGLLFQRSYNVFLSAQERAAFVGFQQEIDELVPGRSRFPLEGGDILPAVAPDRARTLFNLRDCEALYWSDGERWYAVERTAATGRIPLQVTFTERPAGTTETLLTSGGPDRTDEVTVEYGDDGEVAFTLLAASDTVESDEGRLHRSDAYRVEPGRTYDLEIVFDTEIGRFDLLLDGDPVMGVDGALTAGPLAIGGLDDAVGTDGGPDFSGTVERLPATSTICRELADAPARA